MRPRIKLFAGIGCSAFVLLACVTFVAGQEAAPKPLPKQISGGILNGKATSLPKPEYPASARAEKAGGQVGVQVLIDEEGNVISAKAASGPENTALRSAAEAAALRAKFSPTLLSGNPVKVSGVITYNFVLMENDLDEGMKAFMASTVLFLFKDLVADPAKFTRALAEDDAELRSILKEAAFDPDFPELEPLSKLESTPPARRVELLESVLASMAGKLKAEYPLWNFELGRAFSDVLTPVMLMAFETEPDVSKIDIGRIKKGLKVMKQMLANAPPDLSKDVLTKLNALDEFADRDDLMSEQEFEKFSARVVTVFDAVSPE